MTEAQANLTVRLASDADYNDVMAIAPNLYDVSTPNVTFLLLCNNNNNM